MDTKKSIFEELFAVNCNDKVEKKNGLNYLSWAFAWGEVKKRYPDAKYTIYENQLPNGYIVNYYTDGRTCWVKTGVTINGLEHIEELPVMDYKNKSIPFEAVTSYNVNTTIQRSLTKAVARHGLGLYIYAGEDLPEEDKEATLKMLVEKLELTPVNEKREKVIGFLASNSKAMAFYGEKYGVKTIDAYTDEQVAEIYAELIKGGRI